MNKFLLKLMSHGGYMNEADDGTGGGSGSGAPDDKGAGTGDEGGQGNRGGDGDLGGGKDESGAKKPSDAEAKLIKENMKKKADLQKAQDELSALKKSVEGLDLDAVRKLLAEQKSAEEKQLEARGEWDRLKARMAEEHGKQTKALQDQIALLQGEIGSKTKDVNELTIGTAFGQSDFIQKELVLPPSKARVLYADHFDLEAGKVVGYDKPRGSADRTALVDASGTPISFDAALRKIVEADPERDHLLKSRVRSGAGSDSKKPITDLAAKGDTNPTAVSKIATGLKGMITAS